MQKNFFATSAANFFGFRIRRAGKFGQNFLIVRIFSKKSKNCQGGKYKKRRKTQRAQILSIWKNTRNTKKKRACAPLHNTWVPLFRNQRASQTLQEGSLGLGNSCWLIGCPRPPGLGSSAPAANGRRRRRRFRSATFRPVQWSGRRGGRAAPEAGGRRWGGTRRPPA